MSERDMNGDGRFFMTLGPMDKMFARLAALLAVGAALSGCASTDVFSKRPPSTSPATQRIGELERTHRAYPRWSQFPAAPQNVPTPGDIAVRVNDTQAAQAQLLASAAQIQWTLTGDTEAFAAQARAEIDPTKAAPVSANAQQTEEFLRAMKNIATPPPAPAK
jgi:hypothetical protein